MRGVLAPNRVEQDCLTLWCGLCPAEGFRGRATSMNRDVVRMIGGLVAFLVSYATYRVIMWLELEAATILIPATFIVVALVGILWARRFPN
jgi:uncharacterized membrane protein YhhN